MKKAILEIVGFDVKDIITTSGGFNNGGQGGNTGDISGDDEFIPSGQSTNIYG